MAVKFDGSGYIELEEGFTLRPDIAWRLEFSVEFDDGSSFFAGNVSDGGPYIGFSGGGVAIRVGTVIKVNYAFQAGQTYDINIFCDGQSNVTIEVVGIASSTGIQNNMSTFNMFGKYFNEGFQGALIYRGVLSGTFDVTNALEGDRSYNFEQPVGSTTLPDTIGGDQGVLLNFNTGGFTNPVVANQPPSITLNGDQNVTLFVGESYTDPGVIAIDFEDGVVTQNVQTTSNLSTVEPGNYETTYTITDSGGLTSSVTRFFTVIDVVDEAPTIILLPPDPVFLTVGDTYVEPGFNAEDSESGDLTSSVIIDVSMLDTGTPGVYSVFYTVQDEAGNVTVVERTVIVSEVGDVIYDFSKPANVVKLTFNTEPVII